MTMIKYYIYNTDLNKERNITLNIYYMEIIYIFPLNFSLYVVISATNH